MDRCYEQEILDTEPLSDAVIAHTYLQLHILHGWLGNTGAVFKLLRKATAIGPIQRVLDIGCGQGALLAEIRRRFSVKIIAEVIGFDQRPAPIHAHVPILIGNAITEPLPEAEVAICVAVAHHLSPSELAGLIQNVSRTSQRFILLDLVRHPVPLALFRIFVRPFLNRVNSLDGQTSIRRAYTAREMQAIFDDALSRSSRPTIKVSHKVSPFWIRQVVDIEWEQPANN